VIGIGYDDDIGQAFEVIRNVIQGEERILKDPATKLLVLELGASSVDLAVRPWVASADYWGTRSDLLKNIKQGLDAAGISIPYPQQDVHIVSQPGNS